MCIPVLLFSSRSAKILLFDQHSLVTCSCCRWQGLAPFLLRELHPGLYRRGFPQRPLQGVMLGAVLLVGLWLWVPTDESLLRGRRGKMKPWHSIT